MNTGKCPKCDEKLSSVVTQDITLLAGASGQWKGLSHCCPYCSAILGVELNPIAIREDILSGIAKLLNRD